MDQSNPRKGEKRGIKYRRGERNQMYPLGMMEMLIEALDHEKITKSTCKATAVW